MSKHVTTSQQGIGVVGMLGIVFVVLKLTGYIDWSWWWVTLPFWIGIAAVAAIFVIGFVFVTIAQFLEKK